MGPRPAAGAQYLPLKEEEAAAAPADRKPQGGRWLLWLPVLVACATLLALNFNSDLQYHSPQRGRLAPLPVDLPMLPKHSNSFLVDSKVCRIPALDPWDHMVREFVWKPKTFNCTADRPPALIASNITSLFVVEDALPFYNVTADDLVCCYQPFHRIPKGDNSIKLADNCTRFMEEVVIVEEFVRVLCSVDDVKVYEDYHAFVPRKPAVEERCENASHQSPSFDSTAPSVLLLGIDAVSRLNLHRQMPHTVQLLREMGAVEMLGYNKVGDNTFPNLVSALCGLNVSELRNECWPTDQTPFDNCSFVWQEYRDGGFRTVFGEDAPWMGIFNYVKAGFSGQPTDYYLRPFSYTIEEKIGYFKPMNAKLCVGPRLTTSVLLQYVSKFAHTFKMDKYFALFWSTSLSHDYLNYPSLGDDLYKEMLMELRDSGALERTVLVVMSDHGIRWGSIRSTYQGRLEERLPFLFLVFPAWFRERYPAAVANVGRNAHRLTTPFDLFESLRDLAKPSQRLAQAEVRRRSEAVARAAPAEVPRGVSLFLQVPQERSCEQAGIDQHWCTCQRSRPVDRNSPIVQRTAEFLVEQINKLLLSFRQCAQLLLGEIKDVQQQIPQEALRNGTKDSAVHDYLLVIRTEPGNAIFEGTVRYVPSINNLTMAGFVSRLNLYGSQSACVSNYHLKLYCYCSS